MDQGIAKVSAVTFVPVADLPALPQRAQNRLRWVLQSAGVPARHDDFSPLPCAIVRLGPNKCNEREQRLPFTGQIRSAFLWICLHPENGCLFFAFFAIFRGYSIYRTNGRSLGKRARPPLMENQFPLVPGVRARC